MAPPVDINYIAVVVAAVLSMILGALWYSPILFGKEWMSLIGLTEADLKKAREKGMAKSYLMGFIAALVMSYVLANFIDYTQATTIVEGAKSGVWIWLGFVATVVLGTVIWEGKPMRLYVINTGFYLFALMIMGAVLAVWV